MTTEASSLTDALAFIKRWDSSGAAESANYQIFFAELCAALGVPRPNPTMQDEAENAYVFKNGLSTC